MSEKKNTHQTSEQRLFSLLDFVIYRCYRLILFCVCFRDAAYVYEALIAYYNQKMFWMLLLLPSITLLAFFRDVCLFPIPFIPFVLILIPSQVENTKKVSLHYAANGRLCCSFTLCRLYLQTVFYKPLSSATSLYPK